MQTLGILEPTDVIDAILAGIVRNMQTDTPVDTYHKHTHIITHTDTGAYRQLPEELVYIKDRPKPSDGIPGSSDT